MNARNIVILLEYENTIHKIKLSIIIPVYNEVLYLDQVIHRIVSTMLPCDFEIIIIDSGSTDGSTEIVRHYSGKSNFQCIFMSSNKGKGYAVRAGLKCARGEIVIIQDADFEYQPSDYPALLQPLLDGKTTLVIGSRYLGLKTWKIKKSNENLIHLLMVNLGSVFINKLFCLICKTDITDSQSMFKIFLKKNIEVITFNCDGFDFDTELLAKMILRGHRPIEVPVSYKSRTTSQGKKLRVFRDGFLILIQIIKIQFDKNF